MVALDPDDPRAPYIRAADGLRAAIQAGEIAPGAQLPSLPEICAEYDVSPGTARSAVRVLRDEGLVVTRHGVGSFVRTAPGSRELPATAGDLDEIRQAMADLADRVTAIEERLPG
ncbi:MAG: GntR family transcriptional regulator [Pseudonocardia sp.]